MTFKNKKILITGGAGFIGANFVYKFLELGNSVAVMERKETNLWRLGKVKDKITIGFVDIADSKAVEIFITKTKPDIVLHFAAYGAYQRFQQDIDATINTNLKGTINLVNACQKIGVKAFINTGTNSEYGIKEKPMKETDVLEPDNLYGITKAAATHYCQMMARKHDFPVVTLRPFAVYGPFEEKGRLMTDVIKACLTNGELLLSKPDSVRPFLFIEDLTSAYMLAIEKVDSIKGGVFNIGTTQQHTIAEVVEIAKKITETTVEPKYGQITAAQNEAGMWLYDISKAKKILKWKPRHTLEQGLKKDIEWFKAHIEYYA